MKIRTNVKAGAGDGRSYVTNHNEKLAVNKQRLVVKTGVKAGGSQLNHNEKSVSDKKTKSLTVKTGIKSGLNFTKIEYSNNHNEKLAEGVNAIEQKTIGKKLRLSKETVRELRSSELKRAVGGRNLRGTSDASSCCPSNE